MLQTILFVTAGFTVQGVLTISRRSSLADTAVSAMAGLALGLVVNPLTLGFFTPTVDGLWAAALLAFWGGILFFMAHDIGHR